VVDGDPEAVAAYIDLMRGTTGVVPRLIDGEGLEAYVGSGASPGPEEAPMEPRCLRCGSDRVIQNTRIDDKSDSGVVSALQIRVGVKHPDAWMFKDPLTAELRADICGACGHVELRVAHPERLWAEYQELPDQERP
jgi:hypothetical protein